MSLSHCLINSSGSHLLVTIANGLCPYQTIHNNCLISNVTFCSCSFMNTMLFIWHSYAQLKTFVRLRWLTTSRNKNLRLCTTETTLLSWLRCVGWQYVLVLYHTSIVLKRMCKPSVQCSHLPRT